MSPAKRHRFHVVRKSIGHAPRERGVRYRYVIGIDDTEIAQLVQAICPETLAKRAWECLKWQREGERNAARDRADPRGPVDRPVRKLKHR